MKVLFILVPLCFLACSDFNLGYKPGGNPAPPIVLHDTLVDTTIVAADSVIIRPRFHNSDTLYNDHFTLRAGNHMELAYSIQSASQIDSATLYGLSLAEAPLGFAQCIGSASFQALDSLHYENAGSVERYQLSLPSPQGGRLRLRWFNQNSNDLDVSALLLVGYASADSGKIASIPATLRELRDVVERKGYLVYSQTSVWIKIPVQPGDSLNGHLSLDVGLVGSLLSSTEMATLLSTGVEGRGLWKSSLDGSHMHLLNTVSDTLYYILQNDSAHALQANDTLELSHQWWPSP